MKTELLSVGSAAWTTLLAACQHDFYHLPAYVAFIATQTAGEAAALLVRDGRHSLLLPLVIRPIPGGGHDALTPYGYPGPLTTGGDATFVRDALLEGYEHLAAEGLVSLFVRFHPLLAPAPPAGVGTLVRHGHTVAVDLSRTEAELWRDTRAGHRVQIARAEAAGQRVVFDHDWRRFDDFLRIHRETMRRVGADESHHLEEGYFRGLRSVLGRSVHLVTVDIEGEVAAGGVFVETGGIVQFHLAATDDRFLRVAPSKILLHHVRAWSKARGHRWLHLGGGRGGADDSLFRFKAGFSRLRFPFHTLRVVLRPEEYRHLSGDEHADEDIAAGFFPAYRRPGSGHCADIDQPSDAILGYVHERREGLSPDLDVAGVAFVAEYPYAPRRREGTAA